MVRLECSSFGKSSDVNRILKELLPGSRWCSAIRSSPPDDWARQPEILNMGVSDVPQFRTGGFSMKPGYPHKRLLTSVQGRDHSPARCHLIVDDQIARLYI